MAFRQFSLDNQLTVTIYKRKSSKSLRLSIGSDGEVKVSIPLWLPYSAGVTFAKSKLDWIKSQKRSTKLLVNNQPIGKAHHLVFVASKSSKTASRVVGSQVRVTYPEQMSISESAVQKAATAASVRALRSQAEQLLPQRLANLASIHGYQYQSVSVKHLKSRWGSCDQKGNIVLNLYLMQLPWECIDYVLVHELVHTKVMRHGLDFWRTMKHELPNLDSLKAQIRTYQPILYSSADSGVA